MGITTYIDANNEDVIPTTGIGEGDCENLVTFGESTKKICVGIVTS